MRKIVFFVFAVLLPVGAMAAEVSRSRAEQCAAAFFSVSKMRFSFDSEWNRTKATTGIPSYYIFNNPSGGWVVISGEDSIDPVLAYSYTSSLTERDIRGNVRFWFDGMSSEVRLARKSGLKPDEAVRMRWESPAQNTKGGSGKLLQTALWGQGNPYNAKCPVIPGESERSLTGCVATAAAIILRYHKYPEHGKGTIGGYRTVTNRYNIPSFSIDSHEYKLSTIPLDPARASIADGPRDCLSMLMYDLGVMAEMDYSASGSGAVTQEMVQAMAEHMYISRSASYRERAFYNTHEWIEMLKSDIDAGNPVLYNGYDGSSGHAFVMDGYDGNDFFHVNWGWEGQANGYFSIKALGDDKSVHNIFSDNQGAAFGIAPAKDSDRPASAFLALAEYSSYCGFNLVSGKPGQGSGAVFTIGGIFNKSPFNYAGSVRAALLSWDDSVKEEYETVVLGTSDSPLRAGYLTRIDNYAIRIGKAVSPGDKIALLYETADGWKKVFCDYESGCVYEYPLFDSSFIKCRISYRAGDVFEYMLSSAARPVKSVKWFFDGVEDKSGLKILESGTHTVKARIEYRDGSTETVRKTLTVMP